MAHEKNYSNYCEKVGGVYAVLREPADSKIGEKKILLKQTRTYKKKDGTEGKQTSKYVIVIPDRYKAAQEAAVKGNFIRVKGYSRDDSFEKDGKTIYNEVTVATRIDVLKKKDDGTVETATGEPVEIVDPEEETVQIAES